MSRIFPWAILLWVGNKVKIYVIQFSLVKAVGFPVALGIIKAWNTEAEPTLEEIKQLKYALPDPETFFEKE